MKLHPPPEHTLPETEARDLLDRLAAGVGEHVRYPAWRRNIPTYARVCFHEAAHALMCVENGVRIFGVAINPDCGDGYVSPGDIPRDCPREDRADTRARICLAGPGASALLSSIDEAWYRGCFSDLAVARVSAECGTDVCEAFNAKLENAEWGSDWPSAKAVFKRLRAETVADWIGSGWNPTLRTEDATMIRFRELVHETCAWAVERREVLLAVAVELARQRSNGGGRLFGMEGRPVERSIKRILSGRPPHRSNRSHLPNN